MIGYPSTIGLDGELWSGLVPECGDFLRNASDNPTVRRIASAGSAGGATAANLSAALQHGNGRKLLFALGAVPVATTPFLSALQPPSLPEQVLGA